MIVGGHIAMDFMKTLKSKNWDFLSIGLGVGMMILSFGIAFHGGLRYELRNALSLNQRVVLSTVTGEITADGVLSKVVKVRSEDKIFIEVYKMYESGQELITKLAIPDVHDGYFHIKGESTNLLLNDVDGDNIPEIIAPSFDKDLVAHLNVFKFDSNSNRFYLMTSKE